MEQTNNTPSENESLNKFVDFADKGRLLDQDAQLSNNGQKMLDLATVSKNVERLTNLGRLDDQRALLPEDLIAEVVFKTTRGKMEDQELKLTKSQKLGIEIARFEDLINGISERMDNQRAPAKDTKDVICT